MSGIFAKPEEIQYENSYGIKVMFLHGLEGRGPAGTKAKSLSAEWNSLCPSLRTRDLVSLRQKCDGQWSALDQSDIDDAFETPYSDARDAVRYGKPDLVVASSMGAAILFKLIAEGEFTGTAVFCAAAIGNLLADSYVDDVLLNKKDNFRASVWLLGETDIVVSNKHNMRLAKALGGSVIVSPGDGHRLNKAVESNILNSAVLTAFELSSL